MWQEIGILIIGILTVAYVGWKLYKTITTPGILKIPVQDVADAP